MCRLLAYLGPPATLDQLLLDPPHSLLEQSWRPRLQRHGVVNADGFGVGWYDRSRRPEPARYRRAQPIWTDRSFASLAGVVASDAVLAAVRSATPPAPAEESGTPPFAAGRWLFAHNGAVEGFRQGTGRRLRRLLSEEAVDRLEGSSDSEVLFALALDRLALGAGAGPALADVVATVTAHAEGRLTLALTDGVSVAATTWGEPLFVLEGRGRAGSGVLVASEPCDDDPAWRALPDRSLLEATAEGVVVRSLPHPTGGTRS